MAIDLTEPQKEPVIHEMNRIQPFLSLSNSGILHNQIEKVKKDDVVAINGEYGALWLAIVHKNNTNTEQLQVQWFFKSDEFGKSNDMYELHSPLENNSFLCYIHCKWNIHAGTKKQFTTDAFKPITQRSFIKQ